MTIADNNKLNLLKSILKSIFLKIISSTIGANIKAFIINNKRVYKTSDEKILPANKIKNIISSTITVPPEVLNCIAKFGVQE